MNLSEFGFRDDYDPNNRIVKQEGIALNGKEYFVSTVDLGLNHSFIDGPPLYYETMVFPKDSFNDLYCNRYTTRETALTEHEQLVSDLKAGKYELVNDCYFELKDGGNE